MRLYIVRHGQALASAAGGERALTARGMSDAQAAGRLLATEAVDGVLYSPLLRARQTAIQLLEALGDIPSSEEPLLVPPSPCQQVADAVDAASADPTAAGNLVLVSHLPLVAELVGWFSSGDAADYPLPGFPSGGVVALDMDICARGLASIAWYAFAPAYLKQV